MEFQRRQGKRGTPWSRWRMQCNMVMVQSKNFGKKKKKKKKSFKGDLSKNYKLKMYRVPNIQN